MNAPTITVTLSHVDGRTMTVTLNQVDIVPGMVSGGVSGTLPGVVLYPAELMIATGSTIDDATGEFKGGWLDQYQASFMVEVIAYAINEGPVFSDSHKGYGDEGDQIAEWSWTCNGVAEAIAAVG